MEQCILFGVVLLLSTVAINTADGSCPGLRPSKKLLCYLELKGTPPPLDSCLCTHLLVTTPINKLTPDSDVISNIKTMRARNPDLQVLGVASDPAENVIKRRGAYVRGVVSILRKCDLDGIELDLKWSNKNNGKETFLDLIKLLSKEMNKLSDGSKRLKRNTDENENKKDTETESTSSEEITSDSLSEESKKENKSDEKKNKDNHETEQEEIDETSEKHPIVVRLPSQPQVLAKNFDLKRLSKYVNFFTISSENVTDASEQGLTYHPSRLMGIEDILNADSLVDLITGLGAPHPKLVLSLPNFALRFTLSDPEKNLPLSPIKNTPQRISQAELCTLMAEGKWTIERDEDLTAPYAFKNDTWLAFDDPTSTAIKGKYILLRDLAGAAIVSLDYEDWLGKCNKTGLTILPTLYDTFTNMARKSRAAQLISLQEQLHESSPFTFSADVQLSPYRIVRVVDRAGSIHVVRKEAKTEFECSRQGYFRHPSGCNRFYRCVKFNQYSPDFTVFEYDCPAGLAFDEKYEVCVWPGSLEDGGACQGSSEIAPVPRARYACPSVEGYYADPENCRWFFACLDHSRDGVTPLTAYEFRCPFGLVFNEQTLTCDWPWNVAGCGASGGYRAHLTVGDILEGRTRASYATLPDYHVSGGRIEHAGAGGGVVLGSLLPGIVTGNIHQGAYSAESGSKYYGGSNLHNGARLHAGIYNQGSSGAYTGQGLQSGEQYAGISGIYSGAGSQYSGGSGLYSGIYDSQYSGNYGIHSGGSGIYSSGAGKYSGGGNTYAGSNGQYSSEAGKYSGGGSTYAGSNGEYSSEAGKYSGGGSTYAGSNGEYSSEAGKYSGAGSAYAGSNGQYSSEAGKYSGAGSTYAGSNGEYSSEAGKYSGAGSAYAGSNGQYSSGADKYSSGISGIYAGSNGHFGSNIYSASDNSKSTEGIGTYSGSQGGGAYIGSGYGFKGDGQYLYGATEEGHSGQFVGSNIKSTLHGNGYTLGSGSGIHYGLDSGAGDFAYKAGYKSGVNGYVSGISGSGGSYGSYDGAHLATGFKDVSHVSGIGVGEYHTGSKFDEGIQTLNEGGGTLLHETPLSHGSFESNFEGKTQYGSKSTFPGSSSVHGGFDGSYDYKDFEFGHGLTSGFGGAHEEVSHGRTQGFVSTTPAPPVTQFHVTTPLISTVKTPLVVTPSPIPISTYKTPLSTPRPSTYYLPADGHVSVPSPTPVTYRKPVVYESLSVRPVQHFEPIAPAHGVPLSVTPSPIPVFHETFSAVPVSPSPSPFPTVVKDYSSSAFGYHKVSSPIGVTPVPPLSPVSYITGIQHYKPSIPVSTAAPPASVPVSTPAPPVSSVKLSYHPRPYPVPIESYHIVKPVIPVSTISAPVALPAVPVSTPAPPVSSVKLGYHPRPQPVVPVHSQHESYSARPVIPVSTVAPPVVVPLSTPAPSFKYYPKPQPVLPIYKEEYISHQYSQPVVPVSSTIAPPVAVGVTTPSPPVSPVKFGYSYPTPASVSFHKEEGFEGYHYSKPLVGFSYPKPQAEVFKSIVTTPVPTVTPTPIIVSSTPPYSSIKFNFEKQPIEFKSSTVSVTPPSIQYSTQLLPIQHKQVDVGYTYEKFPIIKSPEATVSPIEFKPANYGYSYPELYNHHLNIESGYKEVSHHIPLVKPSPSPFPPAQPFFHSFEVPHTYPKPSIPVVPLAPVTYQRPAFPKLPSVTPSPQIVHKYEEYSGYNYQKPLSPIEYKPVNVGYAYPKPVPSALPPINFGFAYSKPTVLKTPLPAVTPAPKDYYNIPTAIPPVSSVQFGVAYEKEISPVHYSTVAPPTPSVVNYETLIPSSSPPSPPPPPPPTTVFHFENAKPSPPPPRPEIRYESVVPSTLPPRPEIRYESVVPSTLPPRPEIRYESVVPSTLPPRPEIRFESIVPSTPPPKPVVQFRKPSAPSPPSPSPTLSTVRTETSPPSRPVIRYENVVPSVPVLPVERYEGTPLVPLSQPRPNIQFKSVTVSTPPSPPVQFESVTFSTPPPRPVVSFETAPSQPPISFRTAGDVEFNQISYENPEIQLSSPKPLAINQPEYTVQYTTSAPPVRPINLGYSYQKTIPSVIPAIQVSTTPIPPLNPVTYKRPVVNFYSPTADYEYSTPLSPPAIPVYKQPFSTVTPLPPVTSPPSTVTYLPPARNYSSSYVKPLPSSSYSTPSPFKPAGFTKLGPKYQLVDTYESVGFIGSSTPLPPPAYSSDISSVNFGYAYENPSFNIHSTPAPIDFSSITPSPLPAFGYKQTIKPAIYVPPVDTSYPKQYIKTQTVIPIVSSTPAPPPPLPPTPVPIYQKVYDTFKAPVVSAYEKVLNVLKTSTPAAPVYVNHYTTPAPEIVPVTTVKPIVTVAPHKFEYSSGFDKEHGELLYENIKNEFGSKLTTFEGYDYPKPAVPFIEEGQYSISNVHVPSTTYRPAIKKVYTTQKPTFLENYEHGSFDYNSGKDEQFLYTSTPATPTFVTQTYKPVQVKQYLQEVFPKPAINVDYTSGEVSGYDKIQFVTSTTPQPLPPVTTARVSLPVVKTGGCINCGASKSQRVKVGAPQQPLPATYFTPTTTPFTTISSTTPGYSYPSPTFSTSTIGYSTASDFDEEHELEIANEEEEEGAKILEEYNKSGQFGGIISNAGLKGVALSGGYVSSTTISSLKDGEAIVGVVKKEKNIYTGRKEKAKVVVVSRLSDFNPILVGKLGAECSCKSNPVNLKNRGSIANHRTDSLFLPNGEQDLISNNPFYTGTSSSLSPIIIPESVEYQNSAEFSAEYGEKSGGYVEIKPVNHRITTIAPVTKITPFYETAYSSTPSTPVYSVEPTASTIVYDEPNIIPSKKVDTLVRHKPVYIEKSLRPTYQQVLVPTIPAQTIADLDAETRVTSGKAFDRYGPGGWRGLDETLQGSVDCKRPGLFRHPKYCNKFYSCNWDQWKKRYTLHVFNCPVHLAYDNQLGACNWPSKGPACADDNLLV
ncbi:uncharacterized protein LOC142330474 [Lycorma delicatula]|uniref:uncharacterized protein LOC142330474 n=1 Tax=Lycorma delicatula TaxID=130591 RepID=UPI003F515D99